MANDHAGRVDESCEPSRENDPPDVTAAPQGGGGLSVRALDERVRKLIARRLRQLATERADRQPG